MSVKRKEDVFKSLADARSQQIFKSIAKGDGDSEIATVRAEMGTLVQYLGLTS